ncbi:hypothetical protein SCLCIDRAFT_30713 [Scleroderma citrinum Foug A]|uniref:Uncharacterized protein n=1 Tax=Scleroderma citrinum Foug A TaxID=1036808 RepID=A0A0C3DF56_9AGAM|nr:hypothetical protein SCLCIDRAFT_30713 [Scleroderma citrinum Foug A]
MTVEKYHKSFDVLSFFPPIALKGVPTLAEAGQALSILPTVSPGTMVMQPNACPQPLPSDSSLNRVKCKRILAILSQAQQESFVFEGVSFRDYIYIMERLDSDWGAKTWNKLMFLLHLQCLMVSSPSPLHKFIITLLMDELSCILQMIPFPKSITCQPAGNKSFNKASIEGIPDLTIDMWSRHNPQSRRVLLGECAFMQSDENVTEKLQAYVLDAPDILVVCKILIKQGDCYCSPGTKPSIAKGLRSSHGHTWLSLSSVEIHIWVRQPGDSDINLDCLDGDHYTVGTLFPTIDVDDVNGVFQHGLQLIKEAALHEMKASDVEERWLGMELEKAALDTAYEQYFNWHLMLKNKLPYSMQGATQTSQACISRRCHA